MHSISARDYLEMVPGFRPATVHQVSNWVTGTRNNDEIAIVLNVVLKRSCQCAQTRRVFCRLHER